MHIAGMEQKTFEMTMVFIFEAVESADCIFTHAFSPLFHLLNSHGIACLIYQTVVCHEVESVYEIMNHIHFENTVEME